MPNLATENFDGVTAPALPAALDVITGTFVTSTDEFVSSANSLAFAPTGAGVEGQVNLDGIVNTNLDKLSAVRYVKFGTQGSANAQQFKVLLADTTGYDGGGYVGAQLFRNNEVGSVLERIQLYASAGGATIHDETTEGAMWPTDVWLKVTVTKDGTTVTIEIQRQDDNEYLVNDGTWSASQTYVYNGTPGTDVPDVERVQFLCSNTFVTGTTPGSLYTDNWSDDDLTSAGATSYTLTGPTPAEGEVGDPSGNFTVTPNGAFTGTITPDDDADGGTFTPTSLTWSGTSEAQTFTYTPASSGTKSIGATDDGGLTDPSDVSYLAFVAATGFSISGPSTGTVGVASTNFTVSPSPSGSRVVGTVVVTPNDGAATGTFTPTTLTWTDEVGGKTFTYTADAEGEVTISVTNDGGLSNPAGHSYTASEAAATSYTLTAPSPASGLVSVASGNFTLTPNGTYTGTITPSDSGGGGAFTPTSQTWASETGAKTFTYTPASAGVKTISASDDGGLTDPSSVTYTASDPAAVGELNIEAPTGLTLTATIRSDGGLVYDAVSEDLITPIDTLDTYGIALGEVVDGYYAAAAPTLAAGLYTITYYNTATSQAIGFGTLDTRALGGLSGPQDTKLTDIYNKAVNLPASPAAVGSAMTLASGAITAAVIATDAIDADALAANAVAEIQNGLATSAQAIEMLASLQNALITVEAGGLTGTIEIYTPGTAQTVGNLLQTIPISRSATTEPFSFARVS